MSFERFTEKAIKVVILAQEESRLTGMNEVSTAHFLLGLIAGKDTTYFTEQKIGLEHARQKALELFGRRQDLLTTEAHFTPDAKQMLEESLVVAKKLWQSFVSPDTLFLAITELPDSPGCQLLQVLQPNTLETPKPNKATITLARKPDGTYKAACKGDLSDQEIFEGLTQVLAKMAQPDGHQR